MAAKMRILDLFCGAGGCAVGYHCSGFVDVVGIDIMPQPRYPYVFIQGDALDFLSLLIDCKGPEGWYLDDFDLICASPPCQRYSRTKSIHKRQDLPDLVPPTRQLLMASCRPWVIENVPGAPLFCSALVCGLALGLRVKRHRYFESSHPLMSTTCPTGHRDSYVTVAGNDFMKCTSKSWVSVHGGGAPARADARRRADKATASLAMGIDWMTRDELSQAIPPAYTEFIGKQLLQILQTRETP
jgi:DNA (cytosine-5)-methyltransferase 1